MKNLIKSAVNALGYDIRGLRYTPRQLRTADLQRSVEFDDIVCRRMFETSQALRVIQVGVFDGVTRDPLFKYIERCGWTAVLVEPQPSAVAQLHKLYGNNPKVHVLPGALDKEHGSRTLYVVEGEDAPDWAGGLASFDRSVIAKHAPLVPGLEDMIRELRVESFTFDDVLERLGPGPVDLLQMDTEGADAYILSLFPLEKVRPAIIHWEVKHLTTREREACLSRLASYGYRFALSGLEDMLAVAD